VIKKLAILLPAVALALGTFLFSAPATSAQESEPIVVDEVIAQVENDVVTLSMLKRIMRDAVEGMMQQGKSREDATAEVEKKKPELIVALITEQLLTQKGKELDLAADVEAEVNTRLLAAGKEQGITKLEDLCNAMRQQNVDCEEVRVALRAEVMKMFVFNREVDGKIFYNTPDKELQAYYQAHPDKFKKQESVDLSEIYLEFAGKNEASVRAKMEQLLAQARGGADFAALAKANSERTRDGVRTALTDGGEVGRFEIPNLRADIVAAIKTVKAGGVSDPLVTPEGIQIIRVNDRTEGADTPQYNETAVREAITMERSPDARKTYMNDLRKNAYIKVAKNYEPLVLPLLKPAITPTAATTAGTGATADKAKKP
jgi:parvulin-like peptidyl-prolyl isomerase